MSCKDKDNCTIYFEIEQEDVDMSLCCNYIISEGGTRDYNRLINQPQINSITLINNKTSEELGLQDKIYDITEQDIDNIIYGG